MMPESHHPILGEPWTWEIAALEWQTGGEVWSSHLDVTFVRDGVTRCLRFVDPQDVVVEIGGRFPIQCAEMVILDIRDRQLDGLTVQVAEGGASGSPLRLYARGVEEVASD